MEGYSIEDTGKRLFYFLSWKKYENAIKKIHSFTLYLIPDPTQKQKKKLSKVFFSYFFYTW